MLTEEMKKKIEFVKKLDEAIKVAGKNVEQVNYKIFESDHVIREYLEVIYKGGARAARNCTGDSCYAIVEELGSLLYGGYYDEVGHLERYESSPEYKLISELSAEPERKKGKWIERWHDNKHIIGDMACSVCGARMTSTYPKTCPSCGADMSGDYSNSQA